MPYGAAAFSTTIDPGATEAPAGGVVPNATTLTCGDVIAGDATAAGAVGPETGPRIEVSSIRTRSPAAQRRPTAWPIGSLAVAGRVTRRAADPQPTAAVTRIAATAPVQHTRADPRTRAGARRSEPTRRAVPDRPQTRLEDPVKVAPLVPTP